MLAPVLARLDSLPGVAGARVDSSGRFFALALTVGVAPADVLARARDVLGEGARALAADEAEAQLAARRLGDPWLAAGEVMALSFVESRLLAVRLAGELARQAGAGPEQRDAVAEAIRRELFAAMERVHAEGGRRSSGWIYQEWPALAAAAAARCAPALPAPLQARVAELLPGLLAR